MEGGRRFLLFRVGLPLDKPLGNLARALARASDKSEFVFFPQAILSIL